MAKRVGGGGEGREHEERLCAKKVARKDRTLPSHVHVIYAIKVSITAVVRLFCLSCCSKI